MVIKEENSDDYEEILVLGNGIGNEGNSFGKLGFSEGFRVW